jgi:peptidoglycan hydrolase FlgJ
MRRAAGAADRDMTTPVSDPGVYTDLGGLAALKRGAQAQDPHALREAARQFESLFTRMMLKSMRDASFGDPVFGSDSQKFYQGMFDDQLAVQMAKGHGLGLADMLVEQLTRSGSIPAQAPGPAAGGPASGSQAAAASRAASLQQPPEQAMTPADFVRAVWPAAEQAGRELGVAPRSLVAQAALETNWGRSVPADAAGRSSFNLFGVKAGDQWSGSTVAVRTLEFEDGVPASRIDKFRAYGSAAESVRDYVAMLRNNPRYAAALNTGHDTQAFATALQQGGYATDPSYARKLTAVAQNLADMPLALKSSSAGPITTGTGTL